MILGPSELDTTVRCGPFAGFSEGAVTVVMLAGGNWEGWMAVDLCDDAEVSVEEDGLTPVPASAVLVVIVTKLLGEGKG